MQKLIDKIDLPGFSCARHEMIDGKCILYADNYYKTPPPCPVCGDNAGRLLPGKEQTKRLRHIPLADTPCTIIVPVQVARCFGACRDIPDNRTSPDKRVYFLTHIPYQFASFTVTTALADLLYERLLMPPAAQGTGETQEQFCKRIGTSIYTARRIKRAMMGQITP